MFPRPTCPAFHDHVLRLTFTDGATAELDFAGKVLGQVAFAPLANVATAQVAEAHTLVWPHGVDLERTYCIVGDRHPLPLPAGVAGGGKCDALRKCDAPTPHQ
jgi:hypothetical protein